MKQNISVEKCPNCSEGNEEICAINHDPVKGMKQNISVEQLNELSDKVKAKFILDYNIKRWKAENKMMTKIFGTKTNDPTLEEFLEEERFHDPTHAIKLPLLSIGQLIEFLDDKLVEIEKANWWQVRINYRVEDGIPTMDRSGKPELTDALWEACKEILNN